MDNLNVAMITPWNVRQISRKRLFGQNVGFHRIVNS